MRLDRAIFIVTAALAASPGRGATQSVRLSVLETQPGETALPYSRGGVRNTPTPTWGIPLRVGGSVPLRVSWTRSDILLASAFTAGLLMDAGQTRGLARGGWQEFHEANPILGPRPSVGRINVYTAVVGLAVLGTAAVVPARVRPWLLGVAFAVEAFAVARSVRAGIAIGLP